LESWKQYKNGYYPGKRGKNERSLEGMPESLMLKRGKKGMLPERNRSVNIHTVTLPKGKRLDWVFGQSRITRSISKIK